MLVYVRQERQPISVYADDEDAHIACEMKDALGHVERASNILSNKTVQLVHRHSALADIVPDDRDAVVDGLKGWRRNVWSPAFNDVADAIGLDKAVRKAIAPYVSDLGSALWYGIELTDGEQLKSIAKIREELADYREKADGASLLVKAINTVAPIKDKAVNVRVTQSDCARAAALLSTDQIAAFMEVMQLLGAKPSEQEQGE